MNRLIKAWIPAATVKTGLKFIVVCCLCFAGISCSQKSGHIDMDLIPVKSGDQWGYINLKGEYVINPQFTDADFFREGLALVKSADGKMGYISKDGKYKIAADYKDGTPFSEGLAFVVLDGEAPVCIDKSGKKKFELQQAKRVFVFSEGFARFVTSDGKYGFVDKLGKEVISPQFDDANPFSEGLAAILQNDKWGFIDKSGKIVINPQFKWAAIFTENKTLFFNGEKYGFIDKKGNYAINPQFDAVGIFSEGMANIYSGKKYGFINAAGKIEINPQFENAYPFQSGLASVRQNSVWGFIDKTGKMVINPQFDDVSLFFGNVALVKSGKQWGIIDKTGKYVVNPQFDDMKQPDMAVDFWWTPVTSDFYDISEFIDTFFERTNGNNFDGFNASSTLQTIVDNITYGNGANADYNNQYVVNYKKTQKLTSDISISQVIFYASETPFYLGSYYNKKYDFEAKVSTIGYKFLLLGEAKNRNVAIRKALIAEIEKRYNTKMVVESIQSREFGDQLYTAYQGNGKISFAISDNLTLFVGFDKEHLQQLFLPVASDYNDYD